MCPSTVNSFPDGFLTMSVFDRLEAIAGIFIYNQLAPKYLTMAEDLKFDRSTFNNLEMENNPVEGSKVVFKAWLSGKSALPPTWKVLLEKLQTIQMGGLAQEIECFFNTTPVTSLVDRTPVNIPSAPLVSCVSVCTSESVDILIKFPFFRHLKAKKS